MREGAGRGYLQADVYLFLDEQLKTTELFLYLFATFDIYRNYTCLQKNLQTKERKKQNKKISNIK